MRAFYLAYSRRTPVLEQPVPIIPEHGLPEVSRPGSPGDTMSSLSRKSGEVLAERLSGRCPSIEHGWSRAVLVHQIEIGLYDLAGDSGRTSAGPPPPQSDLAKQARNDPFVFDFLTLADDAASGGVHMGLFAASSQLPSTRWGPALPLSQAMSTSKWRGTTSTWTSFFTTSACEASSSWN